MPVLASALLALGCGSSVTDEGIGSGGAAGVSGSTGGSAGTGATASVNCVGEWKGYVDGFAFDDGTNTVTITVDSVTPEVSGHIRFGEKELLSPPTDPDVGYPPGITYFTTNNARRVFSGFEYGLTSASCDGARLKFQALVGELWADWCALQTPIPNETYGGYQCAHAWPVQSDAGGCTQTDPKTQEKVEVDCAQAVLCTTSNVCTCDAQGCGQGGEGFGGPTMDVHLSPTNADGDVGGFDWTVHKVHLEKQ